MNVKERILLYFNSYSPESEIDRLAITQYCAEHKIRVNVPRVSGRGEKVCFEEFRKWLDGDCPEPNDVIIFGDGSAVIVKDVTFKQIIAGVTLSPDGRLAAGEVSYRFQPFRQAGPGDRLRIQKELNRNNLSWNRKKKAVAPQAVPQNNKYIRISLLGEKLAFGVFREFNAEGKIVMYCVKETGKEVRYSLWETLDSLPEAYQVEAVSNQEKAGLRKELEKAGKQWCGYSKRIEPLEYRPEKGNVYYFINDALKVQSKIHMHPKDRRRAYGLNYFLDREEAREIADAIMELRLRQLARKKKN